MYVRRHQKKGSSIQKLVKTLSYDIVQELIDVSVFALKFLTIPLYHGEFDVMSQGNLVHSLGTTVLC